jgi:steroid delta-isomerase-like uncharacterized protein
MPEQYETLLHGWFDKVWNKRDRAAIREMLSEDCINHGLSGPGGDPVRGFDGFEQFHSAFLNAFPELHIEVDDVIADGDKLAGRYTVTGMKDGPIPGMPETNKKVRLTGVGLANVRDGKFVEVWNVVDFPKMAYDLDENTPDVE